MSEWAGKGSQGSAFSHWVNGWGSKYKRELRNNSMFREEKGWWMSLVWEMSCGCNVCPPKSEYSSETKTRSLS